MSVFNFFFFFVVGKTVQFSWKAFVELSLILIVHVNEII